MRVICAWTAVAIVCCAMPGRAEEPAPSGASLLQAEKDLDEGTRLDREGKYTKAISITERALRTRERVLGPNRLEVADCLNLLGSLHRKLGDYTQAEPPLQRALRIRENALGEHHPNVASTLTNLAILYQAKGAYDQAEPLFQRAVRIREAAQGPNHPDVATSLHDLAVFYHAKNEDEQAVSLFQRALKIWEAAPGDYRHLIATLLNNLAIIYADQGVYEQAEPLYRRALLLGEETLGRDHPDIAYPINNLANLYYNQGAYERAIPLYQRAVQVLERALGQDHPSVAVSLNNLATVYADRGAYDDAKPLYERALRIREAALGPKHFECALSFNNLASVYHEQGAYKEAETLYRRALQILEATPEAHVEFAASLDDLGDLYRDQGRYEQAESLYRRELQILEMSLGPSHPHVAQALTNVARFYLLRDQVGAALPLLERALPLSEGRLRKEALVLSESRLGSLLKLLQTQDETIYNLLHEHPTEASARRLALMTALLHKGRSADEIAGTSRTIYRRLEPADRGTFQRLRALRTRFSSLSFDGPGDLSADDYQAHLRELETQGDALEAELAQHSAYLRAQEQLPSPDDVIERVAATLPPDGALIEIVAFSALPLVHPPGTPPSKVPSTSIYFALVLLPSGDIRVADLGPAAAIDDAVWRLRLALSSSQAENYLPAVQRLYRLAFQPLEPLLGAQRRLFIAPDGQLNLVPFAALHDGNRFLADTFDITYLTSGKDLVRKTGESPAARSVVVLADPDFETAPSALAVRREGASAPPAPSILERSASVERFFTQERSGLLDQPLEPLPGTRQEAEAIRRLFPQSRLFLGPAATKQALLDVAAPGILHIATHGFFLGDVVGPPRTRGQDSVGAPVGSPPAQLPSDPLLRAGLVLAGAQAARAAGSDTEKRRAEATVATALELAGIDLWGTEMVVLSACSTGQGEVKRGQGVYGLRRAFTVAGAESLVTSLWKVSDQATHQFMKDFYRQLKGGRGRAEALREAIQRMRKRHAHPYYWAPFILVGNGTPLRSLAPRRPSDLR